MDLIEDDVEIEDEEICRKDLALSKAAADQNYKEAGKLVDEEVDQISLEKHGHLLCDTVHLKLKEVIEELQLPFQLADFQKLSLHVIGSKKNLILISPTGCGKMMVVLLGTLLIRKINGYSKGVSIGTQPLSLLMEEKMTNKERVQNNIQKNFFLYANIWQSNFD